MRVVRSERLRLHANQERLPNEIAVLQRCNHPNIVKLFDVVETERSLFLVMEYVNGKDLVTCWNDQIAVSENAVYFCEVTPMATYTNRGTDLWARHERAFYSSNCAWLFSICITAALCIGI